MQLGCRVCSRITNPIDELGTTMASRITNKIDELGTTMASRRGQRVFSCRSVVMSRSCYTCVLGQRGSRSSCQRSFVVRCLCPAGLLWATLASDVLHGLTISPSLLVFVQLVLIFPFTCKGRGSKAFGRVTKHCGTDLPSQGVSLSLQRCMKDFEMIFQRAKFILGSFLNMFRIFCVALY